ncbi:hypothetical protein HZA45_00885 [Candidatus Peregrinibacteria bacterium]|nr:hypothetical protein [Candidatus Peregrinibacteria bacterium]
MDHYLYFILSLILLFLWGMIFWLRADLRKKMIRASSIGGVAGILAELWYFTDYWKPPTLFGIASISPEDFIVGFAITGIAMTAYDIVMHTTDRAGERPRQRAFLMLFLGGLFSLLIFGTGMKLNSCIVSEAAFIGAALIMCILRPDLLKVSLLSGVLLGILGFILYFFLFSWLAPEFWQTYWLLAGTRLGITIAGVPVTEIAWYASWGMLAGIAHNFAAGKKKKPLRN